MIQEDNKFLGGHLVGIGKVRTNGEVEYQELDKPIHNRITSVGLDHLFQFASSNHPNYSDAGSASQQSIPGVLWAGTNSDTSGSPTYYRAGALEYMSFGSGTAPTTFTDTTLQNGIGSYTNTKYYNTGSKQSLNGTKVNSFGNFSFRISHQSAAVSETTTVNEIGWFGAWDTTSSYSNKVLFARVVLPSPITLNAGEYLITTYQLDESNSNTTATTGSDFFGLKDVNGNTLQYEQKLQRAYSGSNWNVTGLSEPYISDTGSGAYLSNKTLYYPPFCGLATSNSPFTFYFSTNSSTTFAADGSQDTSLYSFATSNSTYSFSIDTYNGVGSTNKYRDKIFVSGAYNPGMAGYPNNYQSIYFLFINGMGYRFGYYDNGVWVPQAWRKAANEQVTFTFRTRYSTVDTTMS